MIGFSAGQLCWITYLNSLYHYFLKTFWVINEAIFNQVRQYNVGLERKLRDPQIEALDVSFLMLYRKRRFPTGSEKCSSINQKI